MDSSLAVFEQLTLGQRVQTGEGDRGTVRYLGAVDDQEGQWVGIEWDDPTRGKHDGVLAGKRYFTCVGGEAGKGGKPATNATFARAAKLRVGVPLADALQAKYGDLASGATTAAEAAGAMSVETSTGRAVEVRLP